MGYVYKQIVTRTRADGTKYRKQSKFYTGRYTDPFTRKRKHIGLGTEYADVAREKLHAIEREAARRFRGEPEDRFEVAAREPIETHLTEWCEAMIGRGVNPKGATGKVERVRRIVTFGSWRTIADINAADVDRFIRTARTEGIEHAGRRQRKAEAGPKIIVSQQTANHYRASAKSFGKWLHESRRLRDNPLVGVKGEKITEARERGILTQEQLDTLYAATDASERVRMRMTGPQRRLLYQIAAETGFRLNECLTLTWGALILRKPQAWATVTARYAKNKTLHEQPLRTRLALLLRRYRLKCGPVEPDTALFPKCDETRAARVLRKDLEDAGLPTTDADGNAIGFHGLRHTFGFIARDHLEFHELQAVMRHSRPELTQRYVRHRVRAGLAATFAKLDSASVKCSKKASAKRTGS